MLDFAWLPPPLGDALQKLFKKVKAKFEFSLVPITLAALTILLGLIGWTLKSFDGTFHSFVFIALRSLADFTPNVKNIDEGNHFTDASALFGVLTLYSSAVVVAATVLRESRRKLYARILARNHVVIIGDSSLASRAVKVWARRDKHLLQIVPPNLDRPPWKSHSVRHALDETMVNAFSLQKARHVFVDLDENGKTLALAYRLLLKLAADAPVADARSTVGDWVIVGRDIDMADHFFAKLRDLRSDATVAASLPRLHFLDPDRLAARHLVSSKPLFLEAETRGRRQVHVLIVGGTPIARHLVELTYLSSLTDTLDPPMVTILTSPAAAQRRRFFAGRASLAGSIDVAFLEYDALDDFQAGETAQGRALRDREERAPVTSIFSTLNETDENIRVAMRLDALRRKTDCFDCSILIREEDEGGEAFLSTPNVEEVFSGFSTFSMADTLLDAELCDPLKRDVLPRALHERYAATAHSPSNPVPSWEDLSESLRRANRNAAIHWLAKMHILGFDVTHLPFGALPRLKADDARALLGTESSPRDERIDHAATCEHRRWMVERFFDGWTLGDVRDETRQTNPLLVPWDQLIARFPQQTLKNREQVLALILCLQTAGDPSVILQRTSPRGRDD